MAYYQCSADRQTDRQLRGCWHSNYVDSGKENRMKGVAGGRDHPSTFRSSERCRRHAASTLLVEYLPTGGPPAAVARGIFLCATQMEIKKTESYIPWTHTVDCAARPGRCLTAHSSPCTRSSRSTSVTIYCTEFMKYTSFISGILHESLPLYFQGVCLWGLIRVSLLVRLLSGLPTFLIHRNLYYLVHSEGI